MAVVGAHDHEFEKCLTETDVRHKLVVPVGWLEKLPPFEEGSREVHFGVLDNDGFHWPFCCSVRNAGYRKPVLQAEGWLKFVNFKKLKVGDKISLETQENHFRETQLKIKAQRLNIHNHWVEF